MYRFLLRPSVTFSTCVFRREVDLDGKNIGGWTPLMYASYIGHDNIANLLLEAGVNVNATTAKGLTPLMLAASCGNESIAYFLLQVQNSTDCNSYCLKQRKQKPPPYKWLRCTVTKCQYWLDLFGFISLIRCTSLPDEANFSLFYFIFFLNSKSKVLSWS